MSIDVLAAGVGTATKRHLEQTGFTLFESEAPSTRALRAAIERDPYDLVLFGGESLFACDSVRSMRKNHIDIPAVRIAPGPPSRKSTLMSAMFLNFGGDDVLVEPIEQEEEVGARLRAVIRRSGPAPDEWLRFEHDGHKLHINRARGIVLADNIPISLTAGEWKLLLLIATSGPDYVARGCLYEQYSELQGVRLGHANIISVFIHRIRSKMGSAHPVLDSLWRVGFRLRGRVQ